MAYIQPGTVAAGDVATAAAWNVITNDVIAHQSSLTRLAYATRVTDYTISSNTFASAAEVFTDVTWTADGTSAYVVEVLPGVCFSVASAGFNAYISLFTGAGTELVAIAQNGTNFRAPLGVFKYFYTPSAGTASLNVRARKEGASADGTLEIAASGGRTAAGLAYIAVYGPVTT